MITHKKYLIPTFYSQKTKIPYPDVSVVVLTFRVHRVTLFDQRVI